MARSSFSTCRRLAAAALVLTLGLASSPATASEKSVRERVNDLVPALLSEKEQVRTQAEQDLFALGGDARSVLETMVQEDDVRRSDLALRLLNSDRWPEPGEVSARPLEDSKPVVRTRRSVPLRLEGLSEDFERAMEEARVQLRDLLERDWPELRLERLPLRDLSEVLREIEVPGLERDFNGVTSGSIVRNGERIEWTRDTSGKVTVTEHRDGEAHTYSSDSADALRREHPELAERLDGLVPGWSGGGRLQLRFPPRLEAFGGGVRSGRERVAPLPRATAHRPMLGVEWERPSAVLLSQLDLGRTGIVVTHVVPGSRAARMGLRLHDVLLSLDGDAIASGVDVTRALRDAGDRSVTAVVVRRGQKLRLTETR